MLANQLCAEIFGKFSGQYKGSHFVQDVRLKSGLSKTAMTTDGEERFCAALGV